jgi:hypothetical protein
MIDCIILVPTATASLAYSPAQRQGDRAADAVDGQERGQFSNV